MTITDADALTLAKFAVSGRTPLTVGAYGLPADTVAFVERMVAEGLLENSKEDPDNNRDRYPLLFVTLTALGRDTVGCVIPSMLTGGGLESGAERAKAAELLWLLLHGLGTGMHTSGPSAWGYDNVLWHVLRCGVDLAECSPVSYGSWHLNGNSFTQGDESTGVDSYMTCRCDKESRVQVVAEDVAVSDVFRAVVSDNITGVI